MKERRQSCGEKAATFAALASLFKSSAMAPSVMRCRATVPALVTG